MPNQSKALTIDFSKAPKDPEGKAHFEHWCMAEGCHCWVISDCLGRKERAGFTSALRTACNISMSLKIKNKKSALSMRFWRLKTSRSREGCFDEGSN